MKHNDVVAASVAKMESAGLPAGAVKSFAVAVEQVLRGSTGLVPEVSIEPVVRVPDYAEVAGELAQPEQLARLCVIKLNGGLGTSMGLDRAKSLIEVKDGRNFLDFIASQILWLRGREGGRGPRFLLMNSFSTRRDSLEHLARYPDLAADGELDFLQNKVPKLRAETLEPVDWPANPDLEWCPPGHGDLYASLQGSGLLDRLIEAGVEFLFVSNSDNLGATVDRGLLRYFAESGLSFLMEVASRTPSDRKGGHLARRCSDGRLLLREVAQCPEADSEEFQDIGRHCYFNTNNLWLRTKDLRAALTAGGGALPLPLIRNEKTVDPKDPASPAVLQLESAMGAAIECFEKAGAVRVPRSRFAPVKTTGDLLALRSDAYRVTEDLRLVLVDGRHGVPPEVVLDNRHYKLVAGLESGFPAAPSLEGCERFEVRGPWRFGPGVICRGHVVFLNEGKAVAPAPAGQFADTTITARTAAGA